MAKYKYYDYSQRVLIPVFYEEQLMQGTLELARWKKGKIEKKVKQLIEEQVEVDGGDGEEETGRRSSGGAAERERRIERLLKKAERMER